MWNNGFDGDGARKRWSNACSGAFFGETVFDWRGGEKGLGFPGGIGPQKLEENQVDAWRPGNLCKEQCATTGQRAIKEFHRSAKAQDDSINFPIEPQVEEADHGGI
jgi:hypothetical protein